MRPVRNGPPDTSKAWVAGWDASITFRSNPYKRCEFVRAFQAGKAAGQRSSDDDVQALKRRLAARQPS